MFVDESKNAEPALRVNRSARRWRHFAVAILALLLALAGCAGGTPGTTTQQQTVDGLSIALERPQQAEILKDYELFVTLKDSSGQPVDGATVFVDMAMPSMPMGTNQPIADALGGGRYRVKSAFTMEGDWKVEVHATVAGKEHVATFDQPVTLQQ
jgi:YtkA-like protein